jgi:hypothetical protein
VITKRKLPFAGTAAIAILPLAGCQRAPGLDILGSFFPAWLVCFAVAVVLTALGRAVLSHFHLKVDLALLFHASSVAFFTFALWLIFFH